MDDTPEPTADPIAIVASPTAQGRDGLAEACAAAAVEIPGYLRHASDLRRVLDGAATDTAVILRPGSPDCTSTDDLAAKLRVVEDAACAEANFYAYGPYRLGALDRVGAAIRSRR